MSTLVSKLLDILTVEQEIYVALLRLSKEKKEAVLGSALPSIDRIVREEQALIAKLSEKERERELCVSALSKEIAGDDITLMSFAVLATPAEQERLDDLQIRMRGLLSELQAVNEVNKRLIESRLDYIRFMTDSMSAGGSSNAYGALGEEARKSGQRTNLYDKKV